MRGLMRDAAWFLGTWAALRALSDFIETRAYIGAMRAIQREAETAGEAIRRVRDAERMAGRPLTPDERFAVLLRDVR